jgi:hypothetical protein
VIVIHESISAGNFEFNKTFIKSLRLDIVNKYMDVLMISKNFRKNFLKKLTYFISMVLKKFSDLIPVTHERSKIFYYLYKSLSKHGGNYFRHDSLYVLNREIKFLKVDDCNNIEGKIVNLKETLYF